MTYLLCAITVCTLLWLSNGNAAKIDTELCHRPCKNETNSFLQEYCLEKDLVLDGNCCKNETKNISLSVEEKIIGIDLRGCGLSNLKNIFQNISSTLIIISLEDNPLHSINDEDFKGLTDVQYLSLPAKVPCPGGREAWTYFAVTNDSVICRKQVDACTVVYNGTCPNNSVCKNTGPGLHECDCQDGYHGYKCLRKGTFPTSIFSGGVTVSTVVICLVMWLLQRRHVKNKSC